MRAATSRPAPTRGWMVWRLSPGLRAYVLVVCLAAGLAVLGGLAGQLPPERAHVLLFAVLLAGGAVAVESRRRLGEPAGVKMHDLLSAWWLPCMALLPPVYALVAPILLLALSQYRVRALVVHRRVFSAAAVGLSYGAGSLLFQALTGRWWTVELRSRPLEWGLALVCSGLLATVLNAVLVSVAVRLADPQTSWRDLLWDTEKTWLDVVELSAGLIVTLAAGLNAILVPAVLPVVVMLQRSFMHTQLSAAARLDGKTQLLNAVTWEREAQAELARLHRTRQSAGVLLVDIDHFKDVNDTYGHVVGDKVLVAVARAMAGELRAGDLLGRFGGEEFAVLLPTASEVEACRAAERLRCTVAAARTLTADGTAVRVTVSIGVSVAATGSSGSTVTDLLAGADAGLYRAKGAGRDRVHLTPGALNIQ